MRFFKYVSANVTHCVTAASKYCGYCRKKQTNKTIEQNTNACLSNKIILFKIFCYRIASQNFNHVKSETYNTIRKIPCFEIMLFVKPIGKSDNNSFEVAFTVTTINHTVYHSSRAFNLNRTDFILQGANELTCNDCASITWQVQFEKQKNTSKNVYVFKK